MAGKILLQQALQKPYERRVFITEILQPVFQNKLQIPTSPIDETPNLSQTETSLIKQVLRYGSIALDDDTDIICYEITLHDVVRLEQNRISIQQYVRKLMVAGDVMLLNFVQQKSPASWRLSLVASDTKVSHTGEIKATKTNAKRYTYLLGQAETCLTAASQLAILESKSNIERKDLIEAFAVEKVSKPFFDEYTKIHYKRFNDYLMASNFKAAVFNGDEKAMRDFVKKLLGRIVFLYFVQKKGWLGSKPDFMMHLFKTSGGNETFYPLWLSELFFNALNAPRPNDAFVMPDKTVVSIPFLNGGLFEKDKHDEHFLTFPPQFFHNTDNFESDKERGFLDFLNAYNFTVYEDSPDDHTVAVDPEMLGHIFENLLEDNKDKGAFYTPKEIVHYMCQESLIEYCLNYDFSDSGITMIKEEKRAFISHFIKKNEIDVDLLKKSSKSYESYKSWFRQLNAALETVRICDPAIGSGAFPMGLLHEIFNAKILLHQAIEGVPPTPKQRVEMKLHIIQNSIYGVDIERGAVDIARLRFWLSLIVDEQTPKALPNLDYKIVVGNSLVSKFEDEVISIDWDKKVSAGKANDFVQHIQRLLKEVADKQKQYFDAEVSKKQALTSKIRALKLELLINQFSFNKDKYMNTTPQLGAMFPTAREIKANTERLLTIANFDKQIKKLQTLKQHPEKPFLHFDWKLDFPEVLNPHLVAENGGFDIVIGNPPYMRQEALGQENKNIFAKDYPDVFNSTADLYVYFYSLALKINKNNGTIGYITPNKWMERSYGQELRNRLKPLNINQIVNYGELKVFQEAATEPMIIILNNRISDEFIKYAMLKSQIEIADTANYPFINYEKNILKTEIWRFTNPLTTSILTKFYKNAITLNEYTNGGVYRGLLTGLNKVFIISKQIRDNIVEKDPNSNEIIKPMVEGQDFNKYEIIFKERFMVATGYDIDVPQKYPAVYEYLLQFELELKKRDDKGKNWWNLRACVYYNEFEKNKIIYYHTAKNHNFYFDTEGYYISANCYIIASADRYLQTLLNSKVFGFVKKYLFPAFGDAENGGRVRLDANKMINLPIPQIPTEQQKPFEKLVDEILTAKKAGKNTEGLEGEIDKLVYKLYELTAAEIEVVEWR